jgi:hypothetical protein
MSLTVAFEVIWVPVGHGTCPQVMTDIVNFVFQFDESQGFILISLLNYPSLMEYLICCRNGEKFLDPQRQVQRLLAFFTVVHL